MPSASDEDRAEMTKRFGSIDSHGPEKYLKDRGWTLAGNWQWSKPGQTLNSMPRDEFECVKFLVHEWDYGGVVDSAASVL